MTWHPSGDYLAVKVDRLTTNRKKAKSAEVFFGKEVRARYLEEDPEMDIVELNKMVADMWQRAKPAGACCCCCV